MWSSSRGLVLVCDVFLLVHNLHGKCRSRRVEEGGLHRRGPWGRGGSGGRCVGAGRSPLVGHGRPGGSRPAGGAEQPGGRSGASGLFGPALDRPQVGDGIHQTSERDGERQDRSVFIAAGTSQDG